MLSPLIRPAAPADLAGGLLRAEFFQIAYATTDIDQACAVMAERYGIGEFRRLEGPSPLGGHIRVELAWVGAVMVELISASGPGAAHFMDGLPDGGTFAMRQHHLGFLLHDAAQWAELEGAAARAGRELIRDHVNAGFMRSAFVAAPELGHYLEYILPEPAGLAFFNAVPRT